MFSSLRKRVRRNGIMQTGWSEEANKSNVKITSQRETKKFTFMLKSTFGSLNLTQLQKNFIDLIISATH